MRVHSTRLAPRNVIPAALPFSRLALTVRTHADLFVLVRPPPSSSRVEWAPRAGWRWPYEHKQVCVCAYGQRESREGQSAPRTSSSVSVTQGGQNSSSTSFDAIAAASVTGHGVCKSSGLLELDGGGRTSTNRSACVRTVSASREKGRSAHLATLNSEHTHRERAVVL
jgi:hypothetical protein